VYWADLQRNRENAWALAGLVQALRTQKKDALAAIVEARLAVATARADVPITGSRFGRAVPATTAGAAAARRGALVPRSR